MTITGIRIIGKHKREVTVSLDDATTLQLTPETYRIFSHHLRKDQSLDEALLADIRRQDLVIRAKAALTHFLSYRARSAAECKRMLSRKGFPPDIVTDTVAHFLDLKFIDTDIEFAERFVRDRILLRPEGRSRLLARLVEKGIEMHVATEIVDALYPPEKETAAALDIARRRLLKLQSNQEDLRKRLLNLLNRRGFEYGIVQNVLAELNL